MDHRLEHDFHIADWLVRPSLNRVEGQDGIHALEPKVMAVLVCLAKHAEQVVVKDELLRIVWADTVVVEKVLTQAISKLRKAFGDDPYNPQIIETVSKTGYRLIGPVFSGYTGDAARASSVILHVPVSPPVPATHRRSIPLTAAVGLVALASLFVGLVTWLLFSQGVDVSVSSVDTVQLTSLPGLERNPALSPDGKWVAFEWDGDDGKNSDIYVKQVDTETMVQVTEDPAADLGAAWSPDGTQIAFWRCSRVEGCAVFITPALGGYARKLDSWEEIVWPGKLSWSPDGTWLAVSAMDASRKTPLRISLISVDTVEKKAITAPPASYYGDTFPVFSPDGKRLAFLRGKDNRTREIYLVSVAGSQERQLTFDGRAVHGLDWAPDGKSIVFSSNRGGLNQLWRIPHTGGRPVVVAASGLSMSNPSLARQGNRMVYENWLSDINIWRLALTMGKATGEQAPVPWVASTRWDSQPAYSPDGQRIAFVSTRSGQYEIWMGDTDGSNPVRLTRFEGPMVSTPRWSPDGEQIVFEVHRAGGVGVYVLHLGSKNPRRLTLDDFDNRAASWSQDGRSIYFASDRSGRWEVWRIPAAGGAAAPITTQGGFAAFESSDGQVLYYTKRDSAGLWRLPLHSGSEELVLDAPTPVDWGNWVLRNEGIYFVQREAARSPRLKSFSFTTETITTIADLPEGSLSDVEPGMSISPDGQWLLYARIDEHRCDLMMVEGLD